MNGPIVKFHVPQPEFKVCLKHRFVKCFLFLWTHSIPINFIKYKGLLFYINIKQIANK